MTRLVDVESRAGGRRHANGRGRSPRRAASAPRRRARSTPTDQGDQETQEWTPDWARDWDGWPVPVERRLNALEARFGPAPPAHARASRPGLGLLLGLFGAAFAVGLTATVLVLNTGGPEAAPATPRAPSSRAEAVAARPLPQLVGRDVDEALALLSPLEVRARQTFRATTSPTGTILAQSPVGGSAVGPGSQVLLVVDVGSPRVRVPDLRGLTTGQATRRLARLGLRVRRWQVVSTQPDGAVVDQSPPPRSAISSGGVVALAVADGSRRRTARRVRARTGTT